MMGDWTTLYSIILILPAPKSSTARAAPEERTSRISSAARISGATTWIAATVIVWLVSLIGVLLLPLILVKKKVQENRS